MVCPLAPTAHIVVYIDTTACCTHAMQWDTCLFISFAAIASKGEMDIDCFLPAALGKLSGEDWKSLSYARKSRNIKMEREG